MNLKTIIGLSFGGVIATSGVVASALYLPQVSNSNNFYGTQLISNQTIYNAIKNNKDVEIFQNNGNVGKFISGTANTSLNVLLNGTNEYANGNYVVLFASDGDPLSNLFLYGNSYVFNPSSVPKSTTIVNFANFGFSNDNGKIKFDVDKVVADYKNGWIQKAYEYLTTNTEDNHTSFKVMAALPSIVIIHDRLTYDAMDSYMKYLDYVNNCLHDVLINAEDGSYTFAKDSPCYQLYLKNNNNSGQVENGSVQNADGTWNFNAKSSLDLFKQMLGIDTSPNASETTDNKLIDEANHYETEYKWAFDLKVKEGANYGFSFNPLNGNLEPNTYTDPFGKTQLYREDIGAKKYVESFKKFKDRFSPSYVNTSYEDQQNRGHFIGFAHKSISEEPVVLADSLTSVPNDDKTNSESSSLSQFAGKSSGSKFAASLISLYNTITNKDYHGFSIGQLVKTPKSRVANEPKYLAFNRNETSTSQSLATWYITK